MSFSVSYIYRIVDQFSGPMRGIINAAEKFKTVQASARASMASLSGQMQSASSKLTNFGTVIGGAAITAGIFKFAKVASTMSDAMADVARVTGLSGKALLAMQERFQAMGRATGRSAEGLAAIAYEGGKLGIANDDLASFVEMVMKTAASFDMTDEEAGRAIGSIRAKLGLSVGSVNELMQRVNFLADNTSASGNAMIDIIERTSGTFKMLGISPEITAGWAAFANQVEVTPELAASGLNMMMVRMMQFPGMLKKMLADPKNAVIDFLKRFEKMPEAQRGTAIIKMFGAESSRFVMKAVSNTRLLDESMKMAGSAKALGSMDREFSNILARSSTAANRIRQTFIDIARAIGGVFLGAFNKISGKLIAASQWMLEFVKAHPGLVKVIGAIGVLLAGLAAIAVPLGILLSMFAGLLSLIVSISGVIAAGTFAAILPVLASIASAVGTVILPIVAIVAAIAAFIAILITWWNTSAQFRQALANLYEAFSPLISVLKIIIDAIGSALAWAFSSTGNQIKSWGDIAATVINALAAVVFAFFKIWEIGFGIVGDVFHNIGWGIDLAMSGLRALDSFVSGVGVKIEAFFNAISIGKKSSSAGAGIAAEKSAARQDNKIEVSGQIGVTASGGAKVESAQIGLNTGYNLAVAQ